jgi:hypothetical protein
MTIFVQIPSTTNLYADLYDWVLPDLPMCPTNIALNAIRDSVIELCERTLLWRDELQQILVVGPTSDTTTDAHVAGDTFVTVTDGTNFSDEDTITIALSGDSEGTSWRGHVLGTPVNNVVTLDGQLPDTVDSGATVTKLEYLYPVTLPADTALAKALGAWLNDSPIEPISPDDLDTEFNNTEFGWVGVNWRTDVNVPTRWYMPDDNTVGLLLAPSAGGSLRINAALKPTRTSTTFPSWIYEKYLEVIASGAKARLMSIPKKPYTDLDLARYHRRIFDDGIANAKSTVATGNTRAPLRTHTCFSLR